MTQQLRVSVAGRVQGVGFRAYTRSVALQHGLRGWARNLSDGRVDILLCGESASVERALAEISQGPPGSRVDQLETRDAKVSEVPPSFEVG